MTSGEPRGIDRIPVVVSFPQTAAFTETYGYVGQPAQLQTCIDTVID